MKDIKISLWDTNNTIRLSRNGVSVEVCWTNDEFIVSSFDFDLMFVQTGYVSIVNLIKALLNLEDLSYRSLLFELSWYLFTIGSEFAPGHYSLDIRKVAQDFSIIPSVEKVEVF